MARSEGRIDNTHAAAHLDVAIETLRRDLRFLDQEGQIRRVHGGFVAAETGRFEHKLSDRVASESVQKQRIAAAAVELLGTASTVYLDEGVIPRMLVGHLPDDRVLTVVTPSLPTAAAIMETSHHELVMIGGRIRRLSEGAAGARAAEFISDLFIEIAFLGTNGISLDSGLTTPDPDVATVKRMAMSNSRTRVMLCEHLKFGLTSFAQFGAVGDLTHIVTGVELSRSRVQAYGAAGPRVLRV